jgi:putative tryptophan/tyrosine transport system substrate-binding protein
VRADEVIGMKRRAFLAVMAASAGLRPFTGSAQTASKRPLIGFLAAGGKTVGVRYYGGLPQGLQEFGYLEGRDYALEARYADGDVPRLQLLAHELVRLSPDAIVADTTSAALAARQATTSIPIVGALLNDPIAMGLVASEARPGGNVTGILIRVQGQAAKQLEIALDAVPGAAKIGILINPNNPSNVLQRQETETAAAKNGMHLMPVEVSTANEIGAIFQTLLQERVDVVVVQGDAMFITIRRRIAAFALASRLPTVFSFREHVEDGGLISYGINLRENYRRAAYYVNRILKGEKPADLPVEFPTKVELVVNLATANALGLVMPSTVLVRADDVIE